MEPLKLEQAKRSDRFSHKKRDNSQNRGASPKRPSSNSHEQQLPKEFLGIPCKRVTFKVPPKEEREAMRLEFEMGKRAEFIKYLAETQQEALKRAGVTAKQLEGMKKGYTPHGFNTHHKLPIHGGGTNDFSNLILIPREPWHDMMHYHLINPQTKGLQEGNEKQIVIPYPETPVFEPSPQYKFLEKWTKKGRKTYGKNKNTSLRDVEDEAKRRIFLAQINRNSGR
ncbi:MAG: HNH endonuclease [Alphaproteobacteria bacterium]|nr:HNH endonuclease [Alphaproteobacteria bacterium]